MDVGLRLRQMRKVYGLSQRLLARRAGLSSGTISMIERNKISPSVVTLEILMQGLGTDLNEFFSNTGSSSEQWLFRAKDMTERHSPGTTTREVAENKPNRQFELRVERYDPGADTGKGMLRHPGQEAGIVLSGELELTVGEETAMLGKGDGFCFSAERAHRYRNRGDDSCEIVLVISPPRPW